MIIIFIGPPFAGKDTQAKLLSTELSIPVFSMGAIIRESYENGDPRAVEGFEKYSMKGLHVPIDLKFGLLRNKIDTLNSCILDNFPANQEDVVEFEKYLSERKLKVNKVFYLTISEEEMDKRLISRGRGDDDPQVVHKRRQIQDQEREFVVDYFRKQGILSEINGKGDIMEIHSKIMEELDD